LGKREIDALTNDATVKGSPRLLIVDDDSAIRDTLRVSLEKECDIVGEADNGLAAIEASDKLRPDVVLLDVSMPVMDGFAAARRLKAARPELHIIFVSQHVDAVYVDEAFRAGGEGYVLKQSAATELATAIREVLAGRSFRSAERARYHF
jgi:DNA-binding NarL/FixJ family response regulator